MKAFLEYYKNQDIIPVHQIIPRLNEHFQRRSGLFRQLGIPYKSIKGQRFLEFGPGTGQNALFTAACEPEELVLVDANPSSLKETSLTLQKSAFNEKRIKTIESTIEDFCTDTKYDFVLCEGVIPFQNDPEFIARKVSESVAPGGLLIITCVDPVSYFSEVLRRTLKPYILNFASSDNSLETLVRFFEPDLKAVPAMTRKHEDWVQDVILHPYRGGKLLSIPQAISVLEDDFDVQGTSPNFLNDWRWFKQMTGDNPGTNEQTINSYHDRAAAFLDYRINARNLQAVDMKQLQSLCKAAYDAHFDAWDGVQPAIDEIVSITHKVIELIASTMPETSSSLIDWLRMVEELKSGKWTTPNEFAGFFGRGQQYISFIKRELW